MADLIDRAALLDDIDVTFVVSGKSPYAEIRGANKIIDRIKAAPAVDAVEVVRCKECTRFSPCEEVEGVSWTGWCNYGEFHTDEDDYCSRGERKET